MVKTGMAALNNKDQPRRFITLLTIHVGCIGLLCLPVFWTGCLNGGLATVILVFPPGVECETIERYASKLLGVHLYQNLLFPFVYIFHYGLLLGLIVWKPLSSRRKGFWYALTIQLLLFFAALYVFINGGPYHK